VVLLIVAVVTVVLAVVLVAVVMSVVVAAIIATHENLSFVVAELPQILSFESTPRTADPVRADPQETLHGFAAALRTCSKKYLQCSPMMLILSPQNAPPEVSTWGPDLKFLRMGTLGSKSFESGPQVRTL
jgi:hypothetical protein